MKALIKKYVDSGLQLYRSLRYRGSIIDTFDLTEKLKSQQGIVHILGSGETMPATFRGFYDKYPGLVIGFNFSALSDIKTDFHFIEIASNYKRFGQLNSFLQKISLAASGEIIINNTGAWYNNNLSYYHQLSRAKILAHKTIPGDEGIGKYLKSLEGRKHVKYKATLLFLIDLASVNNKTIFLHGCNGNGKFFYENVGTLPLESRAIALELTALRNKKSASNRHVTNDYQWIIETVDFISKTRGVKVVFG